MSGLFRAIQHLGSGVGGAREVNDHLTQELEALRDMLGAANEQQIAFRQKVAALEQALDRARKDAARDREFLTTQHDAFIVDLMDEQEKELTRRDRDLDVLRERVAELERRDTVPPPTLDARGSVRLKAAKADAELDALERAARAELEHTAQKLAEDRERARETVQRLQAQRDEAQLAVSLMTKERDEALAQIYRLKSELGGPRIPPSTRPPPVESRRPEWAPVRPPPDAAKTTQDLTLDQLDLDAHFDLPPVSTPQLSVPATSTSAAPRPTVPAPRITSMTPPRSNPYASPLPPERSAPPEDQRATLTESPTLQPLSSSSRPPLKQKPDVSTRPLIGYSVNDDSVEGERLEGVRLSKPPPERGKPAK